MLGKSARRAALAAAAAGLMAVGTFVTPAGAVKEVEREPGPLRVLLAGDSITVNYQRIAAAALRAKGYEVTLDGRPGTGLRDAWACRGQRAEMLQPVNADVVIFQSSANYGVMYPTCLNTPYASPAFFRQWANEARRTQRLLSKNGARFHWLSSPNVESGIKRLTIPMVNNIYNDTAKFPTIDAWTAFGGATFDPDLHSDAAHLNGDGAQLMADLVVEAVG
jgi:hypothetical protein